MSRRSPDRVWQQDRRAFATPSRRRLRIRRYRRRDRAQIRHIICATALRGRPLAAFFEDEQVLVKLFMDYYLSYEPESCFVAESEGRVVGYIVGCTDSRRYQRVVLFRYGPQLLARLLLRLVTARYRRLGTYRTLWWALVRAWREVPAADLRQFPAHVHLGVAPELRTAGAAFYVCVVRLGDALIGDLRARGVRGAARSDRGAGRSRLPLRTDPDPVRLPGCRQAPLLAVDADHGRTLVPQAGDLESGGRAGRPARLTAVAAGRGRQRGAVGLGQRRRRRRCIGERQAAAR